jgi:prepilin-type N-terminal cleavage/methylation domain-containing protein
MRAPSRGFTLVEILVVVAILGLILAMGAMLLRSISATQKRALTTSRLATIEAALVQFVQQQRRLPCPADGSQPVATGGLEMLGAGVCTTQQNGVVPWRTLGLSHADITDGWDRRITYRVGAALVANDALNLSWCDPAGTGGLAGTVCNAACTSSSLGNCTPPSTYLNGKGLNVKNLAGTDVMLSTATPPTGAAYVLISHGESGGGAYLDTGTLATSNAADGTEEQKNYANLPAAAYYVDDRTSDVSGAGHFDDIVARPTVLGVASKSGLGPRSH